MQFNQNVLEATLQTDFGTFVIGVWNLPKGQEVVFLRTKNLSLLLSGFGVGYSWGSVILETENVYTKLLEYARA